MDNIMETGVRVLQAVNWADAAVQAAIIQSVGGVVAAAIAAICAAIVGKHFADRKRLQEKLEIAQNDILFLLSVEEEHCKLHKEQSQQSNLRRVRRMVNENGHRWSGKFTAGRIKAAQSIRPSTT